jgi:hypothetical protein
MYFLLSEPDCIYGQLEQAVLTSSVCCISFVSLFERHSYYPKSFLLSGCFMGEKRLHGSLKKMMSQGPVVLFSCLGVGTVQRLIYYVAFGNLACIFQTELCAAT